MNWVQLCPPIFVDPLIWDHSLQLHDRVLEKVREFTAAPHHNPTGVFVFPLNDEMTKLRMICEFENESSWVRNYEVATGGHGRIELVSKGELLAVPAGGATRYGPKAA